MSTTNQKKVKEFMTHWRIDEILPKEQVDFFKEDLMNLLNDSSPFNKVLEFTKTFGQPVSESPNLPNATTRKLRKNLIKEEYQEYLDGEKNNDIVEIADALADMVYIIAGTAITYGIPLTEIFDEVHDSNMSKLDNDGNPIYREDGKIMKGPNYFQPRIKEIIDGSLN
jgi:predicted HAD superfamily Cof-like phosphohydrolase